MKLFYSLFGFLLLLSACIKDDSRIITVEGHAIDKLSKQPVADLPILVEAVKNGTGTLLTFGGKSAFVGNVKTDANGYYKGRFKIFPEADHLVFYVNALSENPHYIDLKDELYLSEANPNGTTNLDFFVVPKSLLKISFRNATPVSDSDFFSFNYGALGRWSGRMITEEDCGTVSHNTAYQWIGKNVCGNVTVEVEAERAAMVNWEVIKNGSVRTYFDSVFIRRNLTNEMIINY
jgi:hypothetical protein